MKSKSTLFLKSLVMGLLLCLAAGQTNARSTLVRFNLHEAIGLTTPPTASATVAQPLGLLTPGDFGPLQVLAGGAYTLNFAAGDPAIYLPPISLPEDFGFPGADPVPTGRGDGDLLIANAYYAEPPAPNGTVVKVESLAPQDMALGQIVPFETQITVNGETASEDGTITFILGWNTLTTNSGDFGYDARPDDFGYGVIEAFIDTGDGAHNDPGGDALVSSFSWQLVNDEIVGVFTVAGLDDGDVVVLEAWLVLDDTIPVGIGGNVQSRLIDAATGGNLTYSVANSGAISLDDPDGNNGPLGDAISTGNQTVPLLKPSDFFNVQVDLSVTKTDDVDPIALGETLTYTVTVANAAGDNISVANSVVVYDELPADVTFVSASGGGFINTDPGDAIPDGAVQWNVGALAPGESAVYTITVTVNSDAPTNSPTGEDILNTVTVTTISDDTNLENNVDTEPTDVTADVVNILADDNESVTTNEDTPVSGNVLDNVDNPDGGPASVTTFQVAGDATVYNAGETATIAGVGTLVIAADGSYTFTPAADYDGAVPQTTYTVTDGIDTVDSTLDIAITPINDLADANESVITDEDTPVSGNVLDNAVDAEGDPLTVTEFTVDGMTYPAGTTVNLTEGDLTLNADGSYTFTPADDYDGAVPQTTYTVSDGTDTVDSTLDIAITPINDLADANESVITDEDTPVSGNVLDNAVDAEGDPLTVTEFTVDGMTYPAGTTVNLPEGDLTLNADGSYTFTPAADYDGAVPQTTYTVSDGTDTVDSTLDIAITPINDLADANESVTTDEDTPVSGNVLNNVDDPDGGPASVTTFQVAGDATVYNAGETATIAGVGTLVIAADGSYTFTPAADYDGAVPQTTYTVSDGTDTVDSTLDIAITPINDLADANESVITDEDTPVSGNVLNNVDDPDGGPASVTTFQVAGDATVYNAGETATIAGVGTLVIAADGSYTFTPAADYDGAVPQTTYTVSDGTDTVDSTLDIAITPINDLADANESVITDEDTPVSGNVLDNAVDAEGDPLTVTEFTVDGMTYPAGTTVNLTEGDLTLNADGSYTFTPAADYDGAVPQTTYTVSDGTDTVDSTLDIAITPINDLADANESVTTDEDTPVSGNVLDNAVDAEGDPLTVTEFTVDGMTYPAGTTVNLTEGDLTLNADGSYTFTPADDYDGAVPQTTYTVSDGTDTVDSTLDIAITPINDLADANESVITDEDTPVSGNVLDNAVDAEGDPLTVTEFTVEGMTYPAGTTVNLTEGDLTLNADGSYTFTPAADYDGAVPQTTYTVSDGTDTVDSTLDIAITPINDLADANESVITDEDTPVSGNVLDNAVDAEGDPLTVTEFTVEGMTYPAGTTVNLTEGDLTLNADGSYTFTPAADYDGAVPQTTYTVSDGTDTVDSTLDIAITPINDLADANESVITDEDTPVSGNVLDNAVDAEGDPLTVTEFTVDGMTYPAGTTVNLTEGDLTLNADGSYTFTPADDYDGAVPQTTYTVSDGTDTVDSTLDIAITPINDLADANESVTTDEDTPVSGNVLDNVDDPDGGLASVTTFTVAGDATVYNAGDEATIAGVGTLVIGSDGAYTFTPAEDYDGSVPQTTYTVSDGIDTNDSTLDIAITPVNDFPNASNDSYTVLENSGTTTLTPLATDNDDFGGDGPSTGTIAIATSPTNGTVTVNNNGTPNDPTDDTFDYTPNADFNGSDSFTYTITDSNGDESTATVQITVEPVAISIIKTGTFNDEDGDNFADVGETITYSFTVANEGNAILTDVTVTDPKVAVLGGPTTLDIGEIDETTFSGSYTLTQADINAGGVNNQALATGTDPNGNDVTDLSDDNSTLEDEETVTPLPQNPSISIIKSGTFNDESGDGFANVGETISYMFTVTNNGNVTLTNVTVDDDMVFVFCGAGASNSIGTMAPGDVVDVCIASYTLTQADIDAGSVSNQATATGTDPNNQPVSDDSDSTNPADDTGGDDDPTVTPVLQNPAISIIKTATFNDENMDGFADVGETITYSFTVANEGNVTLSNVSVSDPLLTVDGGPLATLAVGATDATTFSGSYALTQDDIDNGSVSNQATATGDDPNGGPVSDVSDDNSPTEDDSTITPTPQNPAISIIKSATFNDENGDGFADVGETITYSFTVANEGNVTLSDVTVSDPLLTVDGGPLASLAVGATDATTFSGSYALTQDDIDNGSVSNQATATGDDPNGGPVSDVSDDNSPTEDDSTITPTPQNPAISIIKTATFNDENMDGFADVGETITYSFTVANEGNVTLSNVSVSDPLLTVDGGPLASLAVGASDATTFSGSYALTQDDIDNGSVSNQATATGDDPNGGPVSDVSDDNSPTEDDSTITPTPQNPAISIIKTATFNDENMDGFADVDETITYNFTVANEGNVTLSDVTVSDQLITVNGGPLATLAVGATDATTFSGSYTITQADIDAGEFANQATATGDDPNGDPVSDDSDDNSPLEDDPTVTDLPQNPAISIIKFATFNDENMDGFADVDETITYNFTVANEGNVTLTNVTVSDQLIAVNGGPLATLAVGATDATTFSGSYTITQADIDAGEFANQATATGDDPNGDPVSDDSDDNSPLEDDPTVTPLEQNPAISIIKFATFNDENMDGFADVGETITYSFTVANEGNVTLSNVSVSDPLLTVDGGPLASLAVGASDATTFSGSYALTQDDIDNGSVSNQATATGDDPNGAPVSDVSDDNSPTEDDSTITPTPQNPAISIIKSATFNDENMDGFADVGETITYSFTVANEGNVTLSDVTVSDQLITVNGGPLATLAVGATDATTFSGSYTITQADIDAGEFANQATATGDDPNGDPVSDDSDDNSPLEDDPTVTDLPQNPAISIIKFATFNDENMDGFADVDETITYNFTVANEGNVTLSDVTVSDQLITVNGGPLATLAVGATDATTFSGSYTITQADIDAGEFANQATATGDDPNGDPVSDDSDDNSPLEDDPTVTPLPQNPVISMVKTFAADAVIAGSAGSSFTLVVTNAGNVTLSDVLIEDLVDSRLEVTGVSGTAGSDADSDGNAQTVEWNIASLAPGASQTITVNFTVDASVAEANGVGGLNDADEVPNVATVGAEAPQGDPGDPGDDITDVATDVIDILVDIDLSIVKTFDPTEVPQGTSQSFTIEVSNAGPSDAVDVSVTDMVNSSLEVTGVSHDAATGDCSASAGQDVNCTVNVPVGETVTVTVDYVTAPFLNDGSSPYGTGIGDDFYFVFLNGSILEGSTDGGPVYLDGVEITDDVSIVTSLSRNDIVFDPPGPDPAFELHLSCSDPFTDGWGQSGGPVEGVDVNWQIAFFTVARYSPQGFLKSCGNLVNDFDVLNTAQSFGDDSYGTQEVFDNATVTVGPGITIDRLDTKGKRLTARLTNWTGEDKVIESIEVVWPESNGNLKKVWLTYGNTSDVIWQGSDASADAILDASDSGWNGATLFTGEAILRFDFQNKVADCPYTIQVYFTDGTWLDIQVSEAECGGAALTQPDDAYQVAIPEQEAALGPDVEIRAFPNPSAADVNIIFSLDRDEDVRLDIYNTLGMRVATLFDGKVRANEQHTVVLRKDQVAYGTYFYRLTTREGSQQGQILILQ